MNRGFTLIEVLIAMVILAFLSFFTSQSIQRALKTRVKVQEQSEKSSTLRDALKVMERDINMAFNYKDAAIELYNKTQDERRKWSNKTTNCKPEDAACIQKQKEDELRRQQQLLANPDQKDPYAHKADKQAGFFQFWGEKEKIDFSSISNIRMTEDSQMDRQAEIGYFLKSCRRRSTQEQSSQCLWRRVSNYIDKEIDKGGEETVLLENVEKLEFKYLGPGRDEEWVDTWVTGDRGDDTTKGKFPFAVEITLAIKDPNNSKDKILTMTTVAGIRQPNNPAEATPKP